VLEREKAVL